MTQPVLRFDDVWRTYGEGTTAVHALRGLTLDVFPAELTAMVGASGSGKTTALNMAGALDRPTRGAIFLEDTNLATLSHTERAAVRRDRLGFVFQAYNLVPVLTAFENAAAVLAVQGVSVSEQRARVMPVLETLGLGALADRRPDQLSGGQQQRVAVARAIAAEPALVLADEPTANLDGPTAEGLLDVMEKLCRERGVTFLFSTHDERVMKRADRVVELVDGAVFEDRRAAVPT